MHGLEIIKRLNKEAQEKFEGKKVTPIKPDIEKKTASRKEFFKKLNERNENENE